MPMIPAETAVGLAILAGSIGSWLALFAAILLLTRPERPEPGPSTQDLGQSPESPAVVSLLVNGWKLNEDAAESTLLDLAGRRYVEFRQPDDDPRTTTVHVVRTEPAGLEPYEQAMYDRVVDVAKGGFAPLHALRFRSPRAASRFQNRIRSAVVDEARSLGLSRPRLPARAIAFLGGLSMLVGAATAVAVLIGGWADDDIRVAGLAGVTTALGLDALLARGYGERDTAVGREAASRWLGVRRWLVDTESFGDLPPAAVAVWDRYLAYGAAVGAARLASEVIDLSVSSRRKIWSSYGGTWRVVRVRYPRLWPHYGWTVPMLLVRSGVALGIAYLLFQIVGITEEITMPGIDLVRMTMTLLMVALGLYGLYVALRSVIDLATAQRVTGEVLWMQRKYRNSDKPSNWYLAVDDGSTDRTTAWMLPSEQRNACSVHDEVEIVVRPWSRRVASVEVTAHRSDPGAGGESGEVAAVSTGSGRELPVGEVGAPTKSRVAIVSTEEVSAALGIAAKSRHHAGQGSGPARSLAAYTDGNDKAVLVAVVATGRLASMALAAHRRSAAPIEAIGDEAWLGDDWAAARLGSTVVSLRLQGPAEDRTTYLPWLLHQAVDRLSS